MHREQQWREHSALGGWGCLGTWCSVQCHKEVCGMQLQGAQRSAWGGSCGHPVPVALAGATPEELDSSVLERMGAGKR